MRSISLSHFGPLSAGHFGLLSRLRNLSSVLASEWEGVSAWAAEVDARTAAPPPREREIGMVPQPSRRSGTF